MSNFGINGIGYNPLMNGLGTYGLGSSGTFGTYADPMSMNMMGMSPYTAGGLGMMGMYNPAFMAQMTQAQQQIEQSQLQHASAMHELLQNNKVEAYKVEDRAFFEKAMEDSGVNLYIENLAKKVREGDQDGICEEIDKLKNVLYTKYEDYYKTNKTKINPAINIVNYIDMLYAKIISAKVQEQVNLRSDIYKYGKNSFEHGFAKNFFGKTYDSKYVDETISYIYGTRVNNKEGKDRLQKIGAKVESGIEYVAAPIVGGLAGAGIAGTLAGMGKVFTPNFVSKHISWNGFKNFSKFGAAIGAIGALATDILWQNSRA